MTRFPVSLRDDIAAHVARVEPNPGAWLLRLREIADRLGLDVTRIDWSGPLITAVHAMVREAENQGRYTETEIRLAASLVTPGPTPWYMVTNPDYDERWGWRVNIQDTLDHIPLEPCLDQNEAAALANRTRALLGRLTQR